MARLLSLPRALSLAQPRVQTLARAAALPLILLLALGLRLYGIDWDSGLLFHPDERAILMRVDALALPPASELGVLLDPDESPWNPRWFPYGSLPLYLVKGVQLALAPVVSLDLWDLRLVGRAISALADVLTVLVVYLLALRLAPSIRLRRTQGRLRVADRRAALMAAALTALAVLHLQMSHFYTVDTLLTLFVLLALYCSVRVAQGGSLRWSALAGASVALALATKVSAAPLVLPLLLAHLPGPWRESNARWGWGSLARGLAVALGTGGLALFLAQPYTFLDWGRFWADVTEQNEVVRRIRDYPYTRQYIDTLPYLYHVRQLTLFGLGLPLGLAAWGGLLFALARAVARRRGVDLLLLAWLVPYLLVVGAFPVKFLRYLLPVTPLLLLFGSHLLVAALDWTRRSRRALEPWAWGAVALVVVATGLYALAYLRIYSQPHAALRATQWLTEHARPEALVLREHWEEALPLPKTFRIEELPLYDPDGPGKTELLAQGLARADYLTFYSSRLYGSIARLRERYPDSSRYYRLLFQERLGYRLVHFEATYPSLPGVALVNDTFDRPGLPVPEALARSRPAFLTFNLGYADDSFVVFDHPQVLVFQNVGRLSPDALRLLLAGLAEEEPAFDPMLMPPEEWAAQQAGGTWRKVMPLDGLGARAPVVLWLLVVYAAFLAAAPLTLKLFRFLPDRGYLLSKPLGLLLLAYVPWLLASLKWAPFSRASVLLGLLLLLALSVALWARSRGELWDFVRQRWRLLVLGEAIFLVAFLSFTLLRMANPDLWHPWYGGEKPFDLAYLNAVVRSTFMPPYDPWFAGGAINYYYFGHFMVAALIKVTGVPSAIAFNLAVPLFFALTATAAFSMGYNLAEGARRSLSASRGRALPPWSPLVAAFGALLFVAVLGNLDGARQLLQGAWGALAHGRDLPSFDYWRSSRMMPPDPPGFEITEFPFFTFLFADLHAHLLALPLAMLSLGLALNTAVAAASRASLRLRFASIGALALAVGGLWATNAWDFPTYLVVGLVALLAGEYLARGSWDRRSLGRALGLMALLVGLAVLLWLPYYLRLENALDSLVPSPAQTSLWAYLAIHGLFLFLGVTLLLVEAREPARRGARWAMARLHGSGSRLAVWGLAAFALGPATLLLAVAATGYATVALLALLFVLVAVVLDWKVSRAVPTAVGIGEAGALYTLFPLILLGLAFGIGMGVDILVVARDLERLNTVFKLYLQAWVFFAVAGGYALWHLGFVSGFFSSKRVGPRAWMAVLAVLLLGAGVYPALGTPARLAQRFQPLPRTLDGMAFADGATYSDDHGTVALGPDKEAIRWLQRTVEGSPVILEAVTPEYRWGGRVSSYTGLPTVLGWRWHEAYRKCGMGPCPAVDARGPDVARVYSTTDVEEALGLLRRYNVAYVYLGETERLYYPGPGLTKFAAMARVGQLAVEYDHAGVTIYRVLDRGPA